MKNKVLTKTDSSSGVPEIHPKDLNEVLDEVHIIDVRRPEEFNNELGHVPGARLVTLGPELEKELENLEKNKEVVFTCRSGARSGHATLFALEMGFESVANLTGGMILWNQLKLPVAREK